jgi:hypothetical protein
MGGESDRLIAVITGDIVGFSKLPETERERLPSTMHCLSKKVREAWGDAVPMDVDVFGGDAWQVFVDPPRLALRVALFLRAGVISEIPGMDTRLAIGVGRFDFISDERVSLSQGDAFTESGRLVAKEKKPGRMWFTAPGHPELEVWNVVFRCLDHLIQRHWTAANALAITGALRGWKQGQIAGLWTPPIRQPSITKHLSSASWDILEAAIEEFESRI